MVEIAGSRGHHLRRYTCSVCEHGWWEEDGHVIELVEALRVMASTGRSRRAKRLAALPR
jgi:hypothetical protein